MEFGKKHSQVSLGAPGLCPSCLERYIEGREGGAKTALVEEVVDGAKTGKWICPDGGRSYAKQVIDDTGDIRGAGGWPITPSCDGESHEGGGRGAGPVPRCPAATKAGRLLVQLKKSATPRGGQPAAKFTAS